MTYFFIFLVGDPVYRKGPSVARTYPNNKEITYPNNKEIQDSAPGKRQESLRGSATSEEDLQGSSSTKSSNNTRSVSDMTRSGSPGFYKGTVIVPLLLVQMFMVQYL